MTDASRLIDRLGPDAQALCRRTWWVFLVGGLASVAFGALAFARPVAAWLVVAMLFAAAIVVDGVFNLLGSLRNRGHDGWWIMLLIGTLGVVVGGYALLNPPVSMMAFIYLVAIQSIMLGVFLIMLGHRVRAATEREWILYLTGALSVVFGLAVIANPAAGGLSVIMLIAAWALVTGALKIVFALRIRRLSGTLPGSA